MNFRIIGTLILSAVLMSCDGSIDFSNSKEVFLEDGSQDASYQLNKKMSDKIKFMISKKPDKFIKNSNISLSTKNRIILGQYSLMLMPGSLVYQDKEGVRYWKSKGIEKEILKNLKSKP